MNIQVATDERRHYLTFTFSGLLVAEAAEKKARYHDARARWWRDQKKARQGALSKTMEGLPPDEDVQLGYLASNTERLVQGDRDKERVHKQEALAYRRWSKLLRRTRCGLTQIVELTYKDCIYFGLGESEGIHEEAGDRPGPDSGTGCGGV